MKVTHAQTQNTLGTYSLRQRKQTYTNVKDHWSHLSLHKGLTTGSTNTHSDTLRETQSIYIPPPPTLGCCLECREAASPTGRGCDAHTDHLCIRGGRTHQMLRCFVTLVHQPIIGA